MSSSSEHKTYNLNPFKFEIVIICHCDDNNNKKASPRARVVILEVGVGTRVPKLSNICMDLQEEFNKASNSSECASIVRINLEVGVSSLVSAVDIHARAKPALTYMYSLLQQCSKKIK